FYQFYLNVKYSSYCITIPTQLSYCITIPTQLSYYITTPT
uniref:Uncharacterized protein n=1 Tax=Ciona savignyi TaxID=51511 RepID=H2Y7Y9_CIOSA